ncbi:MAG: CRISPR-associated endonuclease Cas2 [Deltaproteobacteria bacterium]|nr:CRISPR-associated endonuclease Cas2 [Deltaproteobacteria bacterium]
MPEPRSWHLLLYDVTDDKALRKVHKTLRAWGEPVQYSVFRVRGTAREIERLRFELSRLLRPEDRLLVVRLCDGCAARISAQGEPLSPLRDETPPCRIA